MRFPRKAIFVTLTIGIALLGIMGSACSTPGTTPPATSTTSAAAGAYVNGGLLVNGTWLKAHLADANLVVVDTRKDTDYAGGHVPNAINLAPGLFDGTDASKDSTVLKTAPELSDIFGKNGMSNTSTVVLYGGANTDYSACRIFWALEYLGHKDVHVLDGGYARWTADGNSTATEKTTKPATTFTASVNAGAVATKDYVKNSLGNKAFIIVDSRNATDFVVKRIPGAINVLVEDYLNADKTTKSNGDLTAFLGSKGITAGKTIIVNCYVGYRSSQAYFVFRLMGYTVSNYDGSTTEWFADSSLPTEP